MEAKPELLILLLLITNVAGIDHTCLRCPNVTMEQSRAESPIQLAVVVDVTNSSSGHFEAHLIAQFVESLNSTNGTKFQLHIHRQFDRFVNDTSTNCPYLVVLALLSCDQNARLYVHLRACCSASVLFTLFESLCQRPPSDIGIGIPLLNTLNNLTPMLSDIGTLLANQWPQMTVLHDIQLGQFSEFVKLLKYSCPESEVEEYRLSKESTTRYLSESNMQILRVFKANISKRLFVVIASRAVIEKVIIASKTLSLLNMVNKWVFVLTDDSPVDLLSDQIKDIISESDILLVHKALNHGCSALKLDCLVELITHVLIQSVNRLLTNSNFDLHGAKRQAKNRLLSEIKLLLAHDDLNKSICGNCDEYHVESLVKHRTNDIVEQAKGFVQVNPRDIEFQILTQSEGEWTPFKGFLLKNEHDSETNLKNRPLNIGIVDQPPMIRIYKNGINGNSSQQIVGTTYEMVLVLAAKLNFTPNFVVDYSSDLGHLQSDRSWTGMLKKVVEGEVDIGANGYWKTYDRLRAVYFTFPFNLKEISMLVKKTDEDHKYLFLAPFTWDAWLSIMVTVFLMGPFLWLVHRSSKYYEYYEMRDGKGLFKLGNCVWYCFGAIVQQGGDFLPMAISGRILITFWWLFVIVTVTTYSGNLVALLTFPKIFNPINDLADLIRYKHVLKYGASRTSGIEELIKDSENTALQMLIDNIIYYDSEDVDKLFVEVKQMKMVFLATDNEIRYLISEDFKKYNTCQLMVAKEPILTKSVSFVVGKDKPLRFQKKIDYEVGRMTKSGLVTLWNKKYDVKGDDCLFPLLVRAGDVKKIELSHMVDCFFVLALGVAVGIVSLMFEIVKRHKNADGQIRVSLPRVAHLVSMGQFWQKMAHLYGKVKNGQLYENWGDNIKRFEPGTTKPPRTNQVQNQTRPIYHNYFTYNTTNRGPGFQHDKPQQLQRPLRPSYLQSGLARNGRGKPMHGNPPNWNSWNNANRF